MTTTDATGTLEPMGPSVTVRFVREVAADASRVWGALTTPEQLASWLAQAEFQPSVGAKVRLVWPGQGEVSGEVLECVENEMLEYSWLEQAEQPERSLLRVELEPRGSATTLRLVHSGTSLQDAPGYGAGWQSHLEALDAVLAGGTSSPEQRDARYKELKPAYQAMLTGV